LLNAICAGFKDAPDRCITILEDDDLENDLEGGIIYIEDGFRIYHLVLIFFFAILILLLSLYCYKRYAKRQ